jgi:hypothetical protein
MVFGLGRSILTSLPRSRSTDEVLRDPPPLLFLASGINSSMLDLKGKAKREGEDVLVSKMKQV